MAAIIRAKEMHARPPSVYMPSAEAISARSRGLSIRDRIYGCVALATMLGDGKPGAPYSTRSTSRHPTSVSVRGVLGSLPEHLSSNRSRVQPQSGKLDKQISSGLAFAPMRKTPLLRLSDGMYIALHTDFLLSAADDGIVSHPRRPSTRGAIRPIKSRLLAAERSSVTSHASSEARSRRMGVSDGLGAGQAPKKAL